MDTAIDVFLVALLGALVGCGELVARYRDAPVHPLTMRAGLAYITFNAVAGVSALVIIRTFGWTFGVTEAGPLRLTRILVAGFGSIALFRTSLFVMRIGDQDVGVGPNAFLTAILGAADRSVDRERARTRSTLVTQIMEDVNFSKARAALPTYCLALMQNVAAEEKTALAEDVAALVNNTDMGDKEKTLALGLRLMNLVGDSVLSAAVQALREEIT